MKHNVNRLQTLLSMVKNITTRPARAEDLPLEPWELATVKMEQLELQFDAGTPTVRQRRATNEAEGLVTAA